MSVLVVGSVAIDHIATHDDRRENVLGGSASYASVAASLFGPVRMVGIVGDDFPQGFIKLYSERAIDLEGLEWAPGKTFHWSGVYEKDMNKRSTLVTDLNVFEHFQPKLPKSYQDSAVALLANIGPDLQMSVLGQLDAPKFIIADTMDLWINIAHEALLKLIERIDLLILNDEEARLISGEYNLLRAAKWIRERGPSYVVIKKGEHGSLLFSKEGIFIAPAFPLERVVDPTGAGDTFAGAMAGYLNTEQEIDLASIKQAVLHASVLASFTVEDFSLHRLIDLKREEHDARLDKLLSMTEA